MKRVFGAFIAAIVCGTSGGCGSDVDRYELTGSITHNGQPIPAGTISFDPDASRGNRGPGGYAIIENGRFQTTSAHGTVGGPHIARVRGHDGIPVKLESGDTFEQGRPLFREHKIRVELPRTSAEFDMDVKVPGRS